MCIIVRFPKQRETTEEALRKLALCFCALAAFAARAADEASFRIEKIESGTSCRIVALNRSAAPVTVVLGVSGYASRSGRTWPLREVIAPDSSRELARLSPRGRKAPCQVDISVSSSVGDAFAVPDRRHHYRLPFKRGAAIRIMQEPNGILTTHNNALSRYAVDFGVPRGTPILAARGGIVIEVRDSFSEGRPDPALSEKLNLVSILHTDGSFAQYAHLAPRGVLVRPGERVETGQLIAYSGSTGFAGGPHLHFDLRRAVIRSDGSVVQESLPFDFFQTGTEEKITLRQRKRITVN